MTFQVRSKLPHEMPFFGLSIAIPTTIKSFQILLYWGIDEQLEHHDENFQLCNHDSAAWGAEAYKRFYCVELSLLFQTRPVVNFIPYYSIQQL
mgnify:CR=1 FL=1